MNLPYVAISILHYKNLHDTLECLRSLSNLDYPKFAIFVVNNDTKDHANILQEHYGNRIAIIQNETNVGFAEGQNVAIRAALSDPSVDAVLVLNNDTAVEPSFLREMVSQKADMVAPRVMQMDQPSIIDNLGIVLTSTVLPFNRTSEKQPLFCPSAGCALYVRPLLEHVSLDHDGKRVYFDPTYFAYAEDLDLGWRARNSGFTAAYAPNAVVHHKGSASTGKLSDFAVYHTYRNLVWTQYKNLSLPFFIRRVPWILTGWLSLFVYYLFKGKLNVLLRSIYHGLKGIKLLSNKRSIYQKMMQTPPSDIRCFVAKEFYPKK